MPFRSLVGASLCLKYIHTNRSWKLKSWQPGESHEVNSLFGSFRKRVGKNLVEKACAELRMEHNCQSELLVVPVNLLTANDLRRALTR